VRERAGAWALRWQPQCDPQVVPVGLDASAVPMHELFGPFRSRADALAALRGLAREHRLCTSLVGLDSAAPCLPPAQCRGACRGHESQAAHMLRLIQALARLRMAPWPFAAAIALVEEDRARTRAELHVLRDWRYVGSTASPADLPALQDLALPPFDVDVYRLLRRALEDRTRLRVIDLSVASGREIAWAF
jgi:hypothetical protein